MSDGAMRIVIAAGGTAGHVVPALAVAEALRAEGAQIAFVGADRAERELVPAAGFELHTIAVEGLSRSNPLRAARALALAAAALPRARAILAQLRPDAVMGGGGYVSAPVVAAAITMRVPVVLTEADSRIGLANRLLAPFARRVCLAFPPAGAGAPSGNGRRRSRYRVTGRPLFAPLPNRTTARERLGIAPEETCVAVFGGSLGARSINRAAVEALAGASFCVLHITGARDHVELASRTLRAGYRLFEQLQPREFADVLASADLAVARAGGSVFEIAAHGVPAILIPYPHAASDHQSANAAWMSDAGAAVVIEDGELTAARLSREVAQLVGDPARLAAMAAAARRLARPDAACEVARALVEVARR
jgi:UDP-N-acetylglucosamine--N-acetylmuramyl-(pentapeptide) pyrophosphoryl-undecaprenol N-acetylglucosamine transferase